MLSHRIAKFSCIALLFMTGCGGSDRMTVYPVSGTVTFEGEPMRGSGSIAFIPTGDQPGKAPGGEIDDEGNYILNTYVPGDGAIAGEFRVVINQVTVDEPEAAPDGAAVPVAQKALPEKYFIPAIYSDFKQSPLKATVERKKNQIHFDLKRQASNGAPLASPKSEVQ